ncbi:MAG TPA: ABC transporter ATP-binding protein [Thermoanaerobaculia bacterium]|nr:ABC transporter ATP-binding protein [Thermoanaerobaculia bacterium]
MKVLRRLYGYLGKYKAWAFLAFGSMIVFALTQTVIAMLVQPIVDDVLTPPGVFRKADVSENRIERAMRELAPPVYRVKQRFDGWWGADPSQKWKRVLTVLLIVFLIRAFTSFLSEYSFQKVGLSTVRDLRNQLYERIINQSHSFFAKRSTGEMVSRVVSDADAIQAAVSTRMGDLLQESVTLLGLMIFVFVKNPVLALVSFVGAPLIITPVVQFGKRLRKTTHKSQERMAEIATLLEETIRGVRIVKAFTMEPFEISRFREATRKHLQWNLRAQRVQALTSPVMELLAGVCMVLLFAYAQSRIAAGTLTGGEFASFLTALALMYGPIKKLNKVNLSLNTALSAAERVFRMLDIDNEVKEKADAVELGAGLPGYPVARLPSGEPAGNDLGLPGFPVAQLPGDGTSGKPGNRETGQPFISYEQVSFAYDEREPVLREVDLTVSRGEIVAIVGGSGAGKSTLVNLLPRFYDVSEGRIAIDGVDIRDARLTSLRGLMGFVTQEVVLFNDSVRNNIAYGRSGVDEQQVIDAARAANAHDFIMNLPKGYDTVIGESGVLLSGGQRQRLAIARALFKDPPILILDEATSALDTESERLVQSALTNLMRGRTTLVIAHRLSTIRSAHKIVVLDRGEIVEVGRHEELLVRRGVYRKLYDLQFVDDEVAVR